jgi:hypothetical protein
MSSPIASFVDKLKEQSFTIIILVGVMYYQNSVFTKQMEEYKEVVRQKETQITKVIDDERTRLLEREKYLIQQRDKFIEDMQKNTK